MVFDTLNYGIYQQGVHIQSPSDTHLEYDVFLEYMLDHRDLVLRLAFCELRRFGAAVENRTECGEFRHPGKLLRIA